MQSVDKDTTQFLLPHPGMNEGSRSKHAIRERMRKLATTNRFARCNQELKLRVIQLLNSKTKAQKYLIGFNMFMFLIDAYKNGLMGNPDFVIWRLQEYFIHNPSNSFSVEVNELPYDVNHESEYALKRERNRPLSEQELDSSNWMKIVEYWIKSAYLIAMDEGQGKNIAINVVDDGSCFYQCLAYSMMWYLNTSDKYSSSVLALKMEIISRVYGIDLSKAAGDTDVTTCQPLEEQLENMQKVKIKEGLHHILSAGEAVRAMALFKYENSWISRTTEWANSTVVEMASVAFGLQVIIYQSDDVHSRVAVLNRVTMDFDEKYTADGHPDARYSGHPVMLLLFSCNHYYILSRFPLLPGLQKNGCGIRGEKVPTQLEFIPLKQEMNIPSKIPASLAALESCMVCNGRIMPFN
jgi:hypothetical protein